MKQFNFKLLIFCFAVFSLAGIAQLHAKVVTNDECIEDVHVSDADNKSMYNMMAGKNLAIAGTATQSSTRFGGVASRAIDGNTDGTYNNNSVTSTDETTTTEYWDLDLGKLSSIEEIIFYNRTDCCSDRISQVYVLVANTPFPTDVNDLSGALANADFTFQFANGESSASVTIPVNASGRYVRLQKSGSNISNFLSIAELEVHGVDSDNDNVLDVYDLDTDNDGILDVDEKSTTSTIEAASWSNGTPTTADGLMSNGDVNLNLELTKTDDDATTTSSNSFGTSDDGNRGFNIRIRNGVIFNLHFALGSIAGLANIGHFRLILADGSVISNPSVTISQTSTFSTIDYSTAFPGNTDNLVETIINGDKYYTDTGGTPQASGFLLLDNSVQNLINDGGGVVRIRYRQRSTQPDAGNIFGTSVYGTYQAERDTDNDGIPDHLDLDSDNDGVYDAVEAGADPSILDADGRIDVANQGGVSPGGVPMAANGGAGYTLVDTDSNGVFNPYDLDSDGDGCSDANEYYLKADADGRDGGEYGVGTPDVNASTGVVIAAAYNGTNYADALDNTITRGCQFIQTTTGNWDTTINWEARTVPILTDDAIIRANSTVTTAQNVNNLTVDATYSVSINDAQTLNIKGNLTNNGDFIGAGYVVLDGNAAQQILGDGTDAGSFTHLRIDNAAGVTLSDAADIFDVFDIDAGTFTANAIFTFRCGFGTDGSGNATSLKTAQIDAVSGSIIGNNNFVTEQCYPGRRAYRIASPSATTATTIRANWQEAATAWNADPNPGYGTHITGVSPDPNVNANPDQSQDGTNGFDWQPSGNASMYEWNNNTGSSWSQIDNTNTNNLTFGKPYLMMVRGSRAVDLQSNTSPTSNTILRETGNVAVGDINFDATRLGITTTLVEDDAILVGNPYQAIVDLADVYANSTGIKNSAVIWDPRLGGASNVNQNSNDLGGRGAYVTLNPSTGVNNNLITEMNRFLQPMQSVFFFKDASTDPINIAFKEVYKKVEQDQTQVFSIDDAFKMDVLLYDENSYTLNSTSRDAFKINFVAGANNALDENDFLKPGNIDENLARLHEGTGSVLAMEQREEPTDGEELPMFIGQYRTQDYVFRTVIENVPNNTLVYLKDAYEENTNLLVEGENSTYFSVDPSISESIANDRFSIIFELETFSTDDYETSAISVYPNPVGAELNVRFTSVAGEDTSVQIVDMLGRQVYSKTHEVDASGHLQITNFNLSQGAYVLKVRCENGVEFVHKILKK